MVHSATCSIPGDLLPLWSILGTCSLALNWWHGLTCDDLGAIHSPRLAAILGYLAKLYSNGGKARRNPRAWRWCLRPTSYTGRATSNQGCPTARANGASQALELSCRCPSAR